MRAIDIAVGEVLGCEQFMLALFEVLVDVPFVHSLYLYGIDYVNAVLVLPAFKQHPGQLLQKGRPSTRPGPMYIDETRRILQRSPLQFT